MHQAAVVALIYIVLYSTTFLFMTFIEQIESLLKDVSSIVIIQDHILKLTLNSIHSFPISNFSFKQLMYSGYPLFNNFDLLHIHTFDVVSIEILIESFLGLQVLVIFH